MNPSEKAAAIADYVQREVAGLNMGIGHLTDGQIAAAERAMGRVANFAIQVANGQIAESFSDCHPAPQLETVSLS